MITVVVVVLIVVAFFVILFCCAPSKEEVKETMKKYLEEADELEAVKYERIIVAGIKYRKEQARLALKGLKKGDTVDLVPEPTNPYDRFAVNNYAQ